MKKPKAFWLDGFFWNNNEVEMREKGAKHRRFRATVKGLGIVKDEKIMEDDKRVYDADATDAFLEEQAVKLVKAAKTHACITGEYAEEVAAALRGKETKKTAGEPSSGVANQPVCNKEAGN